MYAFCRSLVLVALVRIALTSQKHLLIPGCSSTNLQTPYLANDNWRAGRIVCCSLGGACSARRRGGVCLSDVTLDLYTYYEAYAACGIRELRLCANQTEVDHSCGSGCGLDNVLTWTSLTQDSVMTTATTTSLATSTSEVVVGPETVVQTTTATSAIASMIQTPSAIAASSSETVVAQFGFATTDARTAISPSTSIFTHQVSTVLGFQLGMTVSIIDPFVSESNLTQVLRKPLAELCGVPDTWVRNVSVARKSDRNLLMGDTMQHRFLSSRSYDDAIVSWQIEMHSGSNLTVTVVLNEFNSKSIAHTTKIINEALRHGGFGNKYEAHVTWKFSLYEQEEEVLPLKDGEDDHDVQLVLVILIIMCLLCCLLVLIRIVYKRGYRSSETFGDVDLSKCSYSDLLFPPDAISQKHGWHIRQLAQSMLDYDEVFDIPIFITYALGKRAQDAENCGPGMYHAAAVAKKLHDNGIRCYCDLMLPEGESSDATSAIMASRLGSCKILLVLLTKGLYESTDSLKEIYAAQRGDIVLIPLRFERDLPPPGHEWLHIGREDTDGIVMLSAVQQLFCKYNSMPSPPYTVLDQPSVLDDLLGELKAKMRLPRCLAKLDAIECQLQVESLPVMEKSSTTSVVDGVSSIGKDGKAGGDADTCANKIGAGKKTSRNTAASSTRVGTPNERVSSRRVISKPLEQRRIKTSGVPIIACSRSVESFESSSGAIIASLDEEPVEITQLQTASTRSSKSIRVTKSRQSALQSRGPSIKAAAKDSLSMRPSSRSKSRTKLRTSQV